MYLDLRDYEAAYKIMFEKLKTEYYGAAVYLEHRVGGALQAAREIENTESLIESLLDIFKDIRKDIYAKELVVMHGCKIGEEISRSRLLAVQRMLQITNPDEMFDRVNLEVLFTDLVERFFTTKGSKEVFLLESINSIQDELNGQHYKYLLHDLNIFKYRLQKLETRIKESMLAQWYEQESKLGKRSMYLLVNSATKVSDVLRRDDTISASVMDVEHPYWYQQESRSVLFVYRPKAEQVLGMFPFDSSTAYVEDYNSVSDALIQLLVSDGLQGKRRLMCNSSGFRPAYSLESLVNKKDNVSEVLLKGECEPVGILLTNERDIKDALAYKQLVPSITLWKLVDGKLKALEQL